MRNHTRLLLPVILGLAMLGTGAGATPDNCVRDCEPRQGAAPTGVPAAEATVLVYDANTRHGYALTAASNLGLPFLRTGASEFLSLLQSRSWELVIMDFPSV